MELNTIDKVALGFLWSRIKKKIKEIRQMEDQKPWYLSKTVIAGLVTLGIGIVGLLGVVGAEAEKGAMVEAIVQIATGVAGVVAIIGRLTATRQITK